MTRCFKAVLKECKIKKLVEEISESHLRPMIDQIRILKKG